MESSSKQPALAAGRRSAARSRSERSTSPAELREYLNSLNNKDIDQLMGPVSQGSLIQGILLATVATIVLLLACTIVPYAMDARSGAAHNSAPQAESAATVAETAPAAAANTSAAATTASGSGAPAESSVAGQPAISKKALGGVDEVKQSDPGVNPLDSKIDDLFDKTR